MPSKASWEHGFGAAEPDSTPDVITSGFVALTEDMVVRSVTAGGTIPKGTTVHIETVWPDGKLHEDAEVTLRFKVPASARYLFDDSVLISLGDDHKRQQDEERIAHG